MEKFSARLNKLIDDIASGNVSEFARLSGIKQPTLHKYVKGRYPNAESLYALWNNFKVNINWLLTGEGAPYLYKDDGDQDAWNRQYHVEGGQDYDSNLCELALKDDIIEQFADKSLARNLNLELVKIERLNPAEFREIGSYIRGIARGLEKASKPNSSLERRLAERRTQGDPDKSPGEGDRRSGLDRRRAVGGDR